MEPDTKPNKHKQANQPSSFKSRSLKIFFFLSQGKVEMAIELLPKEEADSKPAGKGREEPNQNPTLDEPK